MSEYGYVGGHHVDLDCPNCDRPFRLRDIDRYGDGETVICDDIPSPYDYGCNAELRAATVVVGDEQ